FMPLLRATAFSPGSASRTKMGTAHEMERLIIVMSRAIVFATTILGLFALNAAQAAVETGFEEAPRTSSSPGMQLAQYRGDMEVYIDGQGREILVDPYTREVLGVRDPRNEAR